MGTMIPLRDASRCPARIPIVTVLIVLVNCFVLVEGAGQSQTHTEPFRFLEQYHRSERRSDRKYRPRQSSCTVIANSGAFRGSDFRRGVHQRFLRELLESRAESRQPPGFYPTISAFGNSVRSPKLLDLEGFVLEDDDINDPFWRVASRS